jgi:UDP-N-acetylglucosamine 2-epimerase (non-hydrolysing)
MKIISVVGARPNFMKIAPFIRAIEAHNAANGHATPIEHLLVHTGQHYDDRMSKAFFVALGIPAADINLGIGSGSHAEQVGRTMIEFEKVLKEHRPDYVVVVGDVNATCACSITAKKEQIRVAHIEAGLRSFDMAMPEEINRLVTDRLSDLLFTPDEISNDNLRTEGVAEERIHFVGNIMIDTLEANRKQAAALDLNTILRDNALDSCGPMPSVEASSTGYAVMTMHRPSNVDSSEILTPIIEFILDEVCADMPVIWPIHPRARKQLETFDLWEKACACPNLVLLQPLGYHDLLRLNMDSRIMLTDSGGLQEECCVLGTPCLTLRWNTERPVTLQEHGGASVLVGNSIDRIRCEYRKTLDLKRHPQSPPLWDGNTAKRIVEAFAGLACQS